MLGQHLFIGFLQNIQQSNVGAVDFSVAIFQSITSCFRNFVASSLRWGTWVCRRLSNTFRMMSNREPSKVSATIWSQDVTRNTWALGFVSNAGSGCGHSTDPFFQERFAMELELWQGCAEVVPLLVRWKHHVTCERLKVPLLIGWLADCFRESYWVYRGLL